MRIFLIGFMCSGKSTLGHALAKRLSVPFYDLDALVEDKAGMSVSQIFSTMGEDAFRALEAEAIASLATCGEDAVVACGGGTPCRPEAWQAIEAAGGYAVWLKPEDDTRLINRLLEGRASRPLIAGIESADEMRRLARRMLRDREAHYAKADAVFDSSYLENEEEIEASIDKFINLLRQNGK